MSEKLTQQLDDLAKELITPEREFAARTPHSYSHLADPILRRLPILPIQDPGDTLGANIRSLYPDAPQAAIYYFPARPETGA